MRVAFSVWGDYISPVFDVARELRIVEVEDQRIVGEAQRARLTSSASERPAALRELGVQVLVCGAISRWLHAALRSSGVRVIPFVTGKVADVEAALLTGVLGRPEFLMPGCCHRHGSFSFGRKERAMRARQGRGAGQGGGRGQGPCGGFGGPEGFCVCPQCGHREPHERGVPCRQRVCPQCGTPLVREQ
ncbi:MAG: NifB/NifX family molybdenum-iron cluster-binding protein [Calditrichaeota bacterium]|nr:NifB/NifX family molybdenum-iron cluster-binding protein [Calditrichota bacterium]